MDFLRLWRVPRLPIEYAPHAMRHALTVILKPRLAIVPTTECAQFVKLAPSAPLKVFRARKLRIEHVPLAKLPVTLAPMKQLSVLLYLIEGVPRAPFVTRATLVLRRALPAQTACAPLVRLAPAGIMSRSHALTRPTVHARRVRRRAASARTRQCRAPPRPTASAAPATTVRPGPLS